MAGMSNRAQAGQNIFMSSVTLLANTAAVACTFFLTPWLYARSIGFVQNLTYDTYGAGWAEFMGFAWFGICGCFVFAISRASIGTALIFGGLAIVTRFM
ncbi:MAG: hypothetical protein ACRBCT_04180 [Alphaproteobacteria bacterium]